MQKSKIMISNLLSISLFLFSTFFVFVFLVLLLRSVFFFLIFMLRFRLFLRFVPIFHRLSSFAAAVASFLGLLVIERYPFFLQLNFLDLHISCIFLFFVFFNVVLKNLGYPAEILCLWTIFDSESDLSVLICGIRLINN